MARITDMVVTETGIDGLVVLTMKQAHDERGTVREFYRESSFGEVVHPALGPWVQVNVTETRLGAIRGMHGEDMTKLVAVASGRAFGAYVDVRPGSTTFGKLETVDLEPGVQVLVPPGVGNGFQACTDPVQYVYCFDEEWRPGMAGVALTPLDPELGIPWPAPFDPDDPSQLSVKDRGAPTLADVRATAPGDGR